MKLVFVLALFLGSFTVSAAEKQYCGKITHITLHYIDGEAAYNFGMEYEGLFGAGSNSFGWLYSKNKREREILELVKYAKANKLTFCTEFGMPEGGAISVR